MRIAYCIACRCHDIAACHDDATGGPCSWLAVDYEAKRGVCSSCPEDLARWKAGVLAIGPLQSHREAAARDEVRIALKDMLADGQLTKQHYDAERATLDSDDAPSH